MTNVLWWLTTRLSNLFGGFITYHVRPTLPLEFGGENDGSEFGVVIQGPLNSLEEFVINSVQQYQNFWPHAEIIISTWPGK